MTDQKSVWQRVGDHSARNPAGDLYVQPTREGIEEHMSWAVELDRWIVWEWSDTGQKIPHRGASPRAKTDWQELGNAAPFEEAWASYEEHDHLAGVGFVFSEELDEVLEDLDNVVNPQTSAVEEVVEDAIGSADEPAFLSSSGTGVHRYPVAPDATNTSRHPHEVYTTERFAAVTGHCINPGDEPGEYVEHGEDLSDEVDRISEEYNQSSGSGADIGDVEFDSDPVRLGEGDWEPPEALSNAPDAIRALVKALSTEHPDDVGWGQNTFGRYSYLLMLLAEYNGDPDTVAELASSFYCPMIAETQRGNHFKKPSQDAPYGEGVPWDLKEQAGYITRKVAADDLSAPSVETIEEKCNVEIGGCDCPIHGDDDGITGLKRVESELRSSDGQERRDALVLRTTMRNVAEEVGTPIDGAVAYHAPQGTRKTVNAAAGAERHPRLVITGNKDEHRETLEWAAEQFGVSYREIVPFTDHWLCSGRSPVEDEAMELVRAGVEPRYIKEKFGHLVPDDHVDPFDEQFDGPIEEDLLMGSPGHENVAHFRSIEYDDGCVHRDVVFDDVDPWDELDANAFRLDPARAELNELIQFVDELRSDSVAGLLRTPDDVETVADMAKGVPGDDDDEPEAEDLWGRLEAATGDATDAVVVDIAEAVLRCEHVTGKTLERLKALCGVEQRGVSTVRWKDGDGDTVISWVASPNLSDHGVAILGATHQPGATGRWFESVGHDEHEDVDLCPNWRAARRAQGYTVLQLSGIRNSRSGLREGSAYYGEDHLERKAERSRAFVDAIEAVEGEAPDVVDAMGMTSYYDKHGTMPDGVRSMHYAKVRSNNDFKDKDVGLVAGATYYGDDWVGLRAAYAGEQVSVEHPDVKGERAAADSELGEELIRFMVRAAMDQAIGRFGRDTNGGTRVYVDSDEVPGGWPTVDLSDEVVEYNETERAAQRAVAAGAETYDEVCERLDVKARQTRNAVRSLEEKGVLEVEEFELENGRHRISGDSDISLSIYELPEIHGRPGFSPTGAADAAATGPGAQDSLPGTAPGAAATASNGAERGRDGPPETEQTRPFEPDDGRDPTGTEW